MNHSMSPYQSSEDNNLPVAASSSGTGITQSNQWHHGDGPQFDSPGHQSAKLKRSLQAALRYKWLIIGLVILGSAAGFAAGKMVQPIYEAHGAVWISDGGSNNSGPIQTTELLPTGSWVELFRSFAVVDRVVEKRRMFVSIEDRTDTALWSILSGLNSTPDMVGGYYTLTIDPGGGRYALSEKELGMVESGMIGDSIGRKVGFLWAPTIGDFRGRREIPFIINQPRSVAVALIKNIGISMEGNSNFLKVSLSGADKWQTADLLNMWMEEFVATAAELRRRNMSDVAQILESQREQARAALRQAEQELQEFGAAHITEPGEAAMRAPTPAVGGTATGATGGGGGMSLATAFFENQSNFEAAHRDRIALEEVAQAARDGNVAPDVILAIPAVAQAPALTAALQELIDKEGQLRTLRESYTDEYKPVRDLISSIEALKTRTIPNLAQNAASVLRQREQQLGSRLRRDSSQLRNIPERSITEARLRRNLTVAENLYTSLEGRYETTRLGAVSTVPDVNILDPALPSAAPSKNMKLILLVGGFGASLFGALALALILDRLDRKFRYPEQIADELKLEVIGAIPVVPRADESLKDPEAMLHSVEAFRGLRMRTHFAFDRPPVLLTVSSPGAGDGKSMITSNLALAYAEAGFRTLIIDGDIRRGKLHSVFGVDRRPGLLDYLSGQAELEDIIRDASNSPNLSVIPSGTRRHKGPELLTTAALPTLLNILRPRYDVILIDSAPLGAGVDAYAFGVATGSMVVVMRTGVTDRRMAQAKVKLLERFPIRVLGAVVNDVPSAGLYQEYSYLYGYSPDSDMGEEDPGEIGLLTSEISDASIR